MIRMELIEEEFLAEEFAPAEDDLLQEAWPIPPEDYVKEFEEYLMDIGLRF